MRDRDRIKYQENESNPTCGLAVNINVRPPAWLRPRDLRIREHGRHSSAITASALCLAAWQTSATGRPHHLGENSSTITLPL